MKLKASSIIEQNRLEYLKQDSLFYSDFVVVDLCLCNEVCNS